MQLGAPPRGPRRSTRAHRRASQGRRRRSVELDSRAAGRVAVLRAYPATTTHGDAFVADAVARGAVCVVADRAPARRARRASRSRRRGSARTLADGQRVRSSATPRPASTSSGVTGTNGKTTVVTLVAGARSRARLGRGVDRDAHWRSARRPPRPSSARALAASSPTAATAPAGRSSRWRCRATRSTRAASTGSRFDGGGVHEPQPRAPRLPRRRWRTTSRPRRRSSRPSARGARWSASTTPTARAWPPTPASRSRAVSRADALDVEAGLGAHVVPLARHSGRRPAGRAAYNVDNALVAHRRPPARSASADAEVADALARAGAGARPLRGGRDAAPYAWSWTTRTRPTGSSACSSTCARSRPSGTRRRGLRLRRRPRPRQAPAMGAVAATPGRRRRRHVGQPPRRGPRGDHRRDRGGVAGGAATSCAQLDRRRGDRARRSTSAPTRRRGRGRRQGPRDDPGDRRRASSRSTTARSPRPTLAARGRVVLSLMEAGCRSRCRRRDRWSPRCSIRCLRRSAHRPADPRGRARRRTLQGRDADDGRHRHRRGGGRRLPARPRRDRGRLHAQPACSCSAVVVASGIARVRRRLRERPQRAQPRTQQAGQVRRPGGDRRRRSRSLAVALGRRRHDLSFTRYDAAGLAPRTGAAGWSWRSSSSWHGQRGEPDRRPRRTRGGVVDVLLRRARDHRLLAVPPLLDLPRAARPSTWRSTSVGRRTGRRVPRLPVVERRAGADHHGRHGSLAIGAGLARAVPADEPRPAARRDRRALRRSRRCRSSSR